MGWTSTSRICRFSAFRKPATSCSTSSLRWPSSRCDNSYGALRWSLRCLGLLDQRLLPYDNHDAGVGDVKSRLVGFQVVADLRALRQRNVPIDDGPPNARVTADVHVVI